MGFESFINVKTGELVADKQRKKIGEILEEQGLVSDEELNKALVLQKKHRNIPLGQILIKLGIITKEKLEDVMGNFVESQSKKKVGEILLEQNYITEEQLHIALEDQRKTGGRIGEILLNKGFVKENDLINVIAAQNSIIRINTKNIKVDNELVHKLPENIYRKYKAIPLYQKGGKITVAMADPTDYKAVEHLKFRLQQDLETVMDSEDNIFSKIEESFAQDDEQINDLISELGMDEFEDDVDIVEEQDIDELSDMDEEGQQVIKLVNQIITTAIKEGVSDIHIEPTDRGLRIRYRIDGILMDKHMLPIKLMSPLISRLKIISGIDISEKRKPQDGRSQIRVKRDVVDLRFATFPIQTRNYGALEKIVIRILARDESLLSLDLIGFEDYDLGRLRKLLAHPNGVFLVTGPTGSGKSSTLYASLGEIATPEVHIVTLEDPVEYQMAGISQGMVNPKAGFTFASGLKSILRLDPDVVMIGELRDQETVHIAVEAALTGHLVLSTLHTNDSPSAFTRLIDMGIEPFLISSAVLGVLAQRLARRLCSCKEAYRPEAELIEEYNLPADVTLYKPVGCSKCNNSGYKGRTAIFEIITTDEKLQNMIVARKSSREMKRYAIEAGIITTLRGNGLKKVIAGVTSLEEVIKITASDD